MGYVIHCDWCGAALYECDRAKLPVTIDRFKANPLERRWAEETKPTLFFCVDDENGSPGGCFERALRAIRGTGGVPPDMGMEWRLVPVGATVIPTTGDLVLDEVACVQADSNLEEFLNTLAPSPQRKLHRALSRAGISTLEQIEEMTDDEFVAIRECGWTLCRKVRKFIAARDIARTPRAVR